MSLLEILEVTGGGEVGGTQVGETFSTFHTDSREVKQGGVFFALRGAEMDGHQFVTDAIKRGAAAVVAERKTEIAAGIVEVVVPDTWKALFSLASYALQRVSPLVVAVTGSNGKTSTKEMVAAILSRSFNVLRTEGNLNTETGVPLTMLKLEPHHTALVLEMGMQKPGDIGLLASLARPTIGIITNIGIVHIEFFESREQLARAKGELVAAIPEDGLAVLNADNEFFPLLAQMTSARIATFGADRGDYRVENYRATATGSEFTVRGVGVRLGLAGRHQALNAAAALAAGEFAGVPAAAGAAALDGVRVDHRLEEVPAPGGYSIVDDAYNASPESMLAAFEALAAAPQDGRLLAVLGEMRELGAFAEESHRQVGRRAAEVFSAVCVVDAGVHARTLAEAAGAELAPDRAAAVAWVRGNARPGDRVLVKASHGVRLDEVVKELTTA
ncbi:MAG TPA: UDP-N-acetylmuramoyl-tripeptide--D-alanyl-D-alanine ligase [Candidatus Udaeobacter sp.]|nr:UDP-N-acetylmuramoyl-tripeptide--D-alanyl-D-alanine ligase [Candidatus Udaeobacter sp.]